MLKESWTELDQNPEGIATMNTESLPNEVRIFRAIEERMRSKEYPVIKFSLPELIAGGSVLVEEARTTDSECYSTMAKYCGGLDLLNIQADKQSSSSTSMTTASASKGAKKKSGLIPVNRVHQHLLMEPAGQSMNVLHPRTNDVKNTEPLSLDEQNQLFHKVGFVFTYLYYAIYTLYTELGIYHRDLSEGNVLVHEKNGDMYPLLIDFDHSRLEEDGEHDRMQSRTGTLPFMSTLNLAGHSRELTILDELESFLYLWVWKCTIGLSPSEITRSRTTKTAITPPQNAPLQPSNSSKALPVSWKTVPPRKANTPTGRTQVENSFTPQPKVPSVRWWAMDNPGTDCLTAKCRDTGSHSAFESVLDDLRPEFKRLRRLFLNLRKVLFDWDGEQGIDEQKGKRKREATDESGDEGPAPKRGWNPENQLNFSKFVRKAKYDDGSTESDTLVAKVTRRLIDRKGKKDEIVEKFERALNEFFGIDNS
ncbi:hypothetical protein IWQ61_009956 [Dispira simplex]|nr:hypothetical protein IWQ61_009956 [Dispira simplex]